MMISEEEKEFQSRLRNGTQAFGEITDKLTKLKEMLGGDFKKMMGDMAEEVNRINKPLAKRDVEIDGKKIFISLTDDGRVVVNFLSQTDAQRFFNRKSFEEKSWWNLFFKRLKK